MLSDGGLPVLGSFAVTFIGHEQHRCCASIVRAKYLSPDGDKRRQLSILLLSGFCF